uniref:Serine-protein kinase ATM n=1 Tax=Magallana gigas TaxID=29159 RepID=K1QG16_MAGGI
MKTVQATSLVLKTMFSSSLGNELRTLDKADIFQGLQPFFPKRKGNAVNGEMPKTSYEEFAGAINKDGLWWDSTESHSAWLSQLTSALLTSGAVTNPLLYCLKPVCLLKPLTVWDNNFWLDVNYLHIAKAALYCSSHFSTVLYAEIWCNCHRQQEETPKRSSKLYEAVSQSFTQDSQVDSLSSDCEGVSLNVQDILLEAYRQIGDPDGWEKAVITYDIGLQQHAAEQEVDLLKALDSFGSHHLLDNYLENYPKSKTGEIRNLVFMSAIKVGKWDLAIEESPSGSECRFSEAMYRSLNSLKDSQFSLVSSSLDIAREDAIRRLQEASIESCRCLYPILSDLKCVSQIEQALSTLTSSESRSIEDILKAWTQEKLFSNDFEYIEPIYNIRVSVLQVLHNQTDSVQTCMQRELLELSRLAVQNNRYMVAERVVSKLKSLETLDFNLQVDKLTEEANLFWARGEQNIAKHMMKKLLKMLEQKQESNIEAAKLYPRVLSMFGNWLAETHSENPNIIMEDYLEKTVTLLESLEEEGDIILDAHLSLARFADGQYQHIVNYMKSSTFEAKQNLMLKAKREMMRMQQLGKEELDKETLSKQSEIDQSELDAMGEDRERYLKQAVQNYIKCLKHGDKHDIRLFRLVSLWFSNPTSADISGLIMINIENIKSYKFLSLIYQLCARMDTNPPADQTPSLQKALIKAPLVEHLKKKFPIMLFPVNPDTELKRSFCHEKKLLKKLRGREPVSLDFWVELKEHKERIDSDEDPLKWEKLQAREEKRIERYEKL